MNKKWAVLIVAICSLMGSFSYAASGTEGASFLNIPVGARPAALGSAYTSLATDSYAPVWNPGALGYLNTSELAGQHLSYLESIHYEFLSIVHPLQKGRALGFSAQYLGSGDINGTNLNGDSIGTFSSHYGAYSFAFGQALNSRLSLGATGKFIEAKISDVSAHAYAFDFGSLYRYSQRLTFGAALSNLGTALKFISQADPLPLAFRAGGTYSTPYHVDVSLEGAYQKAGLASMHMGVEWKPYPGLALRGGYKTDTLKGLSPIAGLTMGVGIEVFHQEFSYAWVPYGDLGNTQYFSLVLRFGNAPDPKRNLIYHHRKPKSWLAYDKNQALQPDNAEIQNLIRETDPASKPISEAPVDKTQSSTIDR